MSIFRIILEEEQLFKIYNILYGEQYNSYLLIFYNLRMFYVYMDILKLWGDFFFIT